MSEYKQKTPYHSAKPPGNGIDSINIFCVKDVTERRFWDKTRAQVFVTIFSAVAVFLLAFFSYSQIKLSEQQLTALKNQFQIENRAWVFPSENPIGIPSGNLLCFDLYLANSSNIPAKEVIIFKKILFTPEMPSLELLINTKNRFVFKEGFHTKVDIPPIDRFRTIRACEPLENFERNQIVSFIGVINYKDIFSSKQRETTFCFYSTPTIIQGQHNEMKIDAVLERCPYFSNIK